MKDARILVVDDEPGVLDLLRSVLEDQGYEVLTTEARSRPRASSPVPPSIWRSSTSEFTGFASAAAR